MAPPATTAEPLEVNISDLAALLVRPPDARWLYIFCHGAGAGMRHPFMADMAGRLAARNIATLRWELSYMTAGKRRPDHMSVCVREALLVAHYAAEQLGDLKLVAGGKSMGGRVTSELQALKPLKRVRCLAFLGFPLHPAGAPSVARAKHLEDIALPMLFIQGSRDKLADPALLSATISRLPSARLVVIEGADHGFAVPVSRRGDKHPHDVAADALAGWLEALEA